MVASAVLFLRGEIFLLGVGGKAYIFLQAARKCVANIRQMARVEPYEWENHSSIALQSRNESEKLIRLAQLRYSKARRLLHGLKSGGITNASSKYQNIRGWSNSGEDGAAKRINS